VRSIKAQYFISYAVLGSLLPFLAVYLQQTRGLSLAQVGYVLAAANLAPFLGPVVMTFLADTRVASRWLIGMSYLVAAVMLGVVIGVEAFWLTLIAYGLFQIAFEPILPLQDGLNFTVQAQRRRDNEPVVPFHRVRVWGTLGYILPSLVIWLLLRHSGNDHWIVLTAVGFALVGLLNSFILPAPKRPPAPGPPLKCRPRTPNGNGPGTRPTVPTLDALRACLRPPMAVFCLGMLLLITATAAYYGFFPVYLQSTIGMDRQWLGLVAAVGVVVEIPFMLGFGRLLRWLGPRRLMLWSVAAMVLRMGVLAVWIHPVVAIASQGFHGLQVLAIHVLPAVYLNDHAEDHYRSSMQGLFRMGVLGVGRVAGSLLGGWIAAVDVRWVFAAAGVMCLAAGGLFAFAFERGRLRKPHEAPLAEAASPDASAT
jgi:MFS transporter, PPP family, 3-phenylpropionic acid transporter